MGEYKARPHEVHLRLSEEEYRALEKNRAKCRLPQQAYLRKLCLDVQPKEQPPVDFFRVLKELQRIGNSLNQIAAVANRDRWMDADLYWENVKQLQNQMQDLFNQILL
ncbi:MAG: hypothetical protein IJJ25_04700 [Lachnospiraceae bacterium]|nr:hypothetical protein [Lachnospiraceae bacterium]